MKEREYIDLTNLAKLRLAIHAIRDCLEMEHDEGVARTESLKYLIAWQDKLSDKIKVTTKG